MKSGSNREGRFSWMQMRGYWGQKLTVITCYRVSQSTGAGLGEGTAYIQQESLLRMKGQEYPNPRAYCLEVVQTFIEQKRQHKHEIILSVEAKSTTQEGGNDFTSMIRNTGLVDTISRLHGTNLLRTYLNGQRRLDYMLVTPGILPFLRQAWNFVIHVVIPSYYVGYWIQLNVTRLFNGATKCLSLVLQKPFIMRETSKIETFVKVMEMHFRE
jgi:hypothetical protein